MAEDPKLCCHCTYHRRVGEGPPYSHVCRKGPEMDRVNLVTGEVRQNSSSDCNYLRMNEDLCGRGGKYWVWYDQLV